MDYLRQQKISIHRLALEHADIYAYKNKDGIAPLRLGATTWVNPNFRFLPGMTSKVRTSECSLQISDSLWLNKSFVQVLQEKISEIPLKTKQYRYE